MPAQRSRGRVDLLRNTRDIVQRQGADMPETRRSVSDDDALALRLVALLNDDQVLAKLKSVLYPSELFERIDTFTERVKSLTIDLAAI